MSIEDDIKATLNGDTGAGGVKTLLTGGIYTYGETGRLGVSRVTTPDAFDATTGALKPCCVVKTRAQMPDGGARDVGVASYRTVVELWFYDDTDASYATLRAARDRAFALLDETMIGTNKVIPRWIGNIIENARDEELNRALLLRADYDVRGMA